MHKPLLGIALGAIVYCPTLFADTEPLKPTMHALANNLQTILPLIFVPEEELSQNQSSLKKEVGQLIQAFEQSKNHFEHKSPVFKASYNVTYDYLKNTEMFLNKGMTSVAAEKLKLLPSLCVSCHTQDTKQNNGFFGLDRKNFKSDFQFAELSYATRDYGTAIRYFDKYLTTPGSFKSLSRTQTALERLLTLYVQVDHEPAMAATYLNEYIPFIVDFPDLKLQLKQWVTSLENLPQSQVDLLRGKTTLSFDSIKQLASMLESTKAKQNDMQIIVLRGLIHTYLNKSATKQEIPALLYWLALADKKLNYMYYHSFAEIYLNECVTNYEGSEYSAKCKQELNAYRDLA